jgi:type I restriction enzyme R subunit
VPHEHALRIRDDVSFFQAVAAALRKRAPGDAQPAEDMDPAVRPIISRAATPEGMADLFATAGLDKPDASILSDDFLAGVRGMPQRNLAVELLRKLLQGELVTRRRRNVVRSRFFAEKLASSIHDDRRRAITAAQAVEELIRLAQEIDQAHGRGDRLRLSEDELAFYDALDADDSAVRVLGDETLRAMARELVETVHGNLTKDWMLRESVRERLQMLVKRVLRRYDYPTDREDRATRTVLEQAENLSGG